MSMMSMLLAPMLAEKPEVVEKTASWCSACKKNHPVSEFDVARVNRSGAKEYYYICSSVRNERRKAERASKNDLQNRSKIDEREPAKA